MTCLLHFVSGYGTGKKTRKLWNVVRAIVKYIKFACDMFVAEKGGSSNEGGWGRRETRKKRSSSEKTFGIFSTKRLFFQYKLHSMFTRALQKYSLFLAERQFFVILKKYFLLKLEHKFLNFFSKSYLCFFKTECFSINALLLLLVVFISEKNLLHFRAYTTFF